MARKLATAVLTLGCLHASVVSALGLGELKLESFLNEPLTASVSLLNTGGLHEDQIKVRLATSEDFDKLGIDRAYFLTSIKFKISVDEKGNGKIILTSEDPVLEPYLDFLIEARWPSGRLLREYTVLVDPPVFDTQSPIVSATAKVEETEGVSASGKKKTEVTSSSGTHVKTHPSDLADGEMPDRRFGAEASTAPIAGDQYMIRRDETLWGIADRSRPEGVSVHQTMLDIQRLNPNAFINGNINQIKAGYIIYLPASADITSEDLAGAEEAVRQQNQDWRDNQDSIRAASSGASLRISAEPAQLDAGSDDSGSLAGSAASSDQGSDAVSGEDAELAGRLVAMEQQLETLQRIVNLKDDQISALQQALADSDTEGEVDQQMAAVDSGADDTEGEIASENTETGSLEDEDSTNVATETPEAVAGSQTDAADTDTDTDTDTDSDSDSDAAEAVAAAAAAEAEPVAVAKPAPAKVTTKPAAEESGGFGALIAYVLGGLAVIGLGGFLFMRRRNQSAESDDLQAELAEEDVFADIELQDSEVEGDAQPMADLSADLELDPLEDIDDMPGEDDASAEPAHGQGYGEHKHDEYASDEQGDALAEADIYIAYGRYPQAVDLLKTAISNEPSSSAFRVKLIELNVDMGDREEARNQFAELQSLGDVAAIARAEEILHNAGGNSDWLEDIDSDTLEGDGAVNLTLVSDSELATDSGEALEADFGELEIEPLGVDLGDDDLDLSADFSADDSSDEESEEEMVFAEDGSEMSTKLDLARAYLDMGDEDGAKQILEEVVEEGSAGQKEEAKVLLERLG